MFENFINFYNELEISGLFFFWLLVFSFFLLLFLTINLIKKNKELVNILNKEVEKNNTLTIEHNKIVELYNEEKNKEKENVSIELQEEIKESNKDLPKEEIKKEVIIEKSNEELPKVEKSTEIKKEVRNIPYQGLHYSQDRRFQTSPINIIKEDKINLNALNNSNEKAYEKEEDNISYIEQISKKMSEEVTPQTIELTDYEKKQEEEAIISYQELLDAKDKLYNITDDEEIDIFIDNLKEFRASLEP